MRERTSWKRMRFLVGLAILIGIPLLWLGGCMWGENSSLLTGVEPTLAPLASPAITRVAWSTDKGAVGQRVTLTAETTGVANGTRLRFVVYEVDDFLLGEGELEGGRNEKMATITTTVSSGRATATWVIADTTDGLNGVWNPPEYKFVASIPGSPSVQPVESGLLQVFYPINLTGGHSRTLSTTYTRSIGGVAVRISPNLTANVTVSLNGEALSSLNEILTGRATLSARVNGTISLWIEGRWNYEGSFPIVEIPVRFGAPLYGSLVIRLALDINAHAYLKGTITIPLDARVSMTSEGVFLRTPKLRSSRDGRLTYSVQPALEDLTGSVAVKPKVEIGIEGGIGAVFSALKAGVGLNGSIAFGPEFSLYFRDGVPYYAAQLVVDAGIEATAGVEVGPRKFETVYVLWKGELARQPLLEQPIPRVATPTFSPSPGTYPSSVRVTIACATSGATIRYTTNGTDPTSSSPIYSSPLTFTTTTTLKVRAFKSGAMASAVATGVYTIGGKVATPTFSPSPGTYPSSVRVTIACATSGATIRYTTNGTDPTSSSPIYTAPLAFTTTTTLKARAFKSGMADSDVATGTYTITSAVRVPTVETRSATDVTGTTATIHGVILSDGGSPILHRAFCWAKTSDATCSEGSTSSVTVSGNSFSFRLTGLQPGTTYYFRARAMNSAGWGSGTVLWFRTSEAAPPRILSVTSSSGTVAPGGTVTFTYTVTNPGSAIQVLLGASIRLPGGPTLSDPTNDRKVTLASGTTTVTRAFVVPTTAPSGTYDLLASLVEDLNNNGRIDSGDRSIDLKTFTGVLRVLKFNIGDRVQVHSTGSAGLVVRDTPCGSQITPNKRDGATGVVQGGPEFCGGYGRWRIQWSDGRVGWSAEDWLRRY